MSWKGKTVHENRRRQQEREGGSLRMKCRDAITVVKTKKQIQQHPARRRVSLESQNHKIAGLEGASKAIESNLLFDAGIHTRASLTNGCTAAS